MEEQITEESEEPESETKKVQELAEQVKACVIEGQGCKDLSSKFNDAAKELGIDFDQLLDQVFDLVAREKG